MVLGAALLLMKISSLLAVGGAALVVALQPLGAAAQTTAAKADSVVIRKIYDEALLHGQSYDNLRYLCQRIGARLSGSPQAEMAVQWGKLTMEKANCFDKVYLQECMVPHWVRGAKEKGQIVGNKGKSINAAVCALGGSVSTPGNKPLRAGVVEVKSLAELKALPDDKVRGKFIFFNRPFDDKLVEPGAAYGGAGDQRRSGPAEAGRRGAVSERTSAPTAPRRPRQQPPHRRH
jgi:carboxypeptidase Q